MRNGRRIAAATAWAKSRNGVIASGEKAAKRNGGGRSNRLMAAMKENNEISEWRGVRNDGIGEKLAAAAWRVSSISAWAQASRRALRVAAAAAEMAKSKRKIAAAGGETRHSMAAKKIKRRRRWRQRSMRRHGAGRNGGEKAAKKKLA